MSIFGNYARYYDCLYRDKNYAGEAAFIGQLLRKYAPAGRTILELGSGTGHHAQLLAEAGYQIAGVDGSATMIRQAQQRRAQLAPEVAERLAFSEGDIRTMRLGQTFDAIIALFHVVSYQTTNADLLATFHTMRQHLNPNGVAVFDFWYGPSVLTDRPTTRIKRFEDDLLSMTRLAESTLSPNENLVRVHYEILIKDKATRRLDTLEETHVMRYLFYPELEELLGQAGLRVITACEWLKPDVPLSFESWNGMLVAAHCS